MQQSAHTIHESNSKIQELESQIENLNEAMEKEIGKWKDEVKSMEAINKQREKDFKGQSDKSKPTLNFIF